MRSWTFKQSGTRTRATLRIEIERTVWRLVFTVLDPEGRVIDVFTFELTGVWLEIMKRTME